ncbi:MAG: pyridoxal-phosphate dependent enzyme [Planctomycetes bacterium]|nr:pyridoxal-phosphate dependent enzyme [Planctomycetota bacterium]
MTNALALHEDVLDRTARRCAERGVVIPTFAQMNDPGLVPADVKAKLRTTSLWDPEPVNLFRISWRNEPVESGGLYNDGNWIEFPSELTGVDARIVGLVGKWFPTGAHKVGAAFGCLVPRLVTGAFDPERQRAVWPSTGNFCRGGAFDCALLGCRAVGILPEEMSKERFAWLAQIGAEVIATPGCESNVKEIYDACWEIKATRPECVIFNQFEEFGNPTWHYHVTGDAVQRTFRAIAREGDRLAAWVSATGSAGTLAAGNFLKTLHPALRIVAVEALQCPTLLSAGFGGHRIEGIGDKHVPWIHDARSTDVVVAVDDAQCLDLARLFNEPAGRDFLATQGVPEALVGQLDLLGISSICNLVAAIKTAKLLELGAHDVLAIPLTDSMQLYGSRLDELRGSHGAYDALTAARHFGRWIEGIGSDSMRELTLADRKAIHNLKYFTWVEQQQRSVAELNRLWDPDFWTGTFAQVETWERLITDFNARVAACAGAPS